MVDDDESNRDMLSRRLQHDGYTVQIAANGVDALRLLRSTPFDAVLLDLIMAGLDGYLVLLKMKDDGIARCIEARADDYLTKPFNPTLLRARLGACLEKKRLRKLSGSNQNPEGYPQMAQMLKPFPIESSAPARSDAVPALDASPSRLICVICAICG